MSDAQRSAMREHSVKARTRHRIRTGFPDDYAVLGPERIDTGIALGMARAARHGFHESEHVEQYVELMLLLGACFDDDPLYPWAAEILSATTIVMPRTRMHYLRVTAANFLVQTAGRDGHDYRLVLARLRNTSFDGLFAGVDDADAQSMRHFLHRLYPQHCARLSAAALADLHVRAATLAADHGMACTRGVLLLAGAMLLIGTHFVRDPFHPWVGPVLHRHLAPDDKARALYVAAMHRLDRHGLARARQSGGAP